MRVALTLLLVMNGCIDPDIALPMADECFDITGTWSSNDYSALAVEGDGTYESLVNLSMTLDVERQVGCTFRATNTWTNGVIGGIEHVAGLLHRDNSLISMIEIGGHPLGGSTARVLGRLVSDNQMEWEYAGWSNNGDRGIVFSTIIHREGTPDQREICPDITGSWVSGDYDALAVNADGTHDTSENLSMSLEIEHQNQCAFRVQS